MTIRIGVLGAAAIAPIAVIDPAAELDGVEVTAVAARDPERAAELAREHEIPQVLSDYQAVIDDPQVDAVYIPTPASLHGYWTKQAIAAGKPVLCEKPFTANAAEAREVAAAANAANVLVMEAMHSPYHPIWQEAKRVLGSGDLGKIESVYAEFSWPIPDKTDIRWNPDLAGGALMDMGIYPVTLVADLFGPVTVQSAAAEAEGGVDGTLTAQLTGAAGEPITLQTSMDPDVEMAQVLRVKGTRGSLTFTGFVHPHNLGHLSITRGEETVEVTADPRSSYSYMLEAFRDAIQGDAGVPTDTEAAIVTMQLVDDLYEAAGLAPREPAK